MLNITPNHSIYAIAQNFSAGADLEFLYEGGGGTIWSLCESGGCAVSGVQGKAPGGKLEWRSPPPPKADAYFYWKKPRL